MPRVNPLAELLTRSALHDANGEPDPSHFGLALSSRMSVPAAPPATASPAAPAATLQGTNALTALAAPPPAAAAPPQQSPMSPVMAHAHAAGQRIPGMSDPELTAYRGHNAAANMAFSGLLANPGAGYADVMKALTELAQRGAMPIGEALEIAAKLPSDPAQLRRVVVSLQELIGHLGTAMRAEHHRRSGGQ